MVRHFFGRALGDDTPAVDAGAGADVEDKVGAPNRFLVVLHHDYGVAQIAQAAQRVE